MGCCGACDGSGYTYDIATNGRCWDCYGTGHCHAGACDPEAMEAASVERYRRRIAHERSSGKAEVSLLLDQMCRDLGLDPMATWRNPRMDEELMRAFRMRWMCGMAVKPPDSNMLEFLLP